MNSVYFDSTTYCLFYLTNRMPPAECLARVLIQAGQFIEAEKIYREDLKKYKENGWALIGLYQALLKQGKKSEAQLVKYRYDKAWQYADMPLKSSVF